MTRGIWDDPSGVRIHHPGDQPRVRGVRASYSEAVARSVAVHAKFGDGGDGLLPPPEALVFAAELSADQVARLRRRLNVDPAARFSLGVSLTPLPDRPVQQRQGHGKASDDLGVSKTVDRMMAVSPDDWRQPAGGSPSADASSMSISKPAAGLEPCLFCTARISLKQRFARASVVSPLRIISLITKPSVAVKIAFAWIKARLSSSLVIGSPSQNKSLRRRTGGDKAGAA